MKAFIWQIDGSFYVGINALQPTEVRELPLCFHADTMIWFDPIKETHCIKRVIEIRKLKGGKEVFTRREVLKLQELMLSIRETGLQTPILIGSDLRIIDGLLRVEACLRLGLTEIE